MAHERICLLVQWVQETQVPSLGWEDPWRGKWQPAPVFLPGKFHGQGSLAGYGPWGSKESDWLRDWACAHACAHAHTHTHRRYMWATGGLLSAVRRLEQSRDSDASCQSRGCSQEGKTRGTHTGADPPLHWCPYTFSFCACWLLTPYSCSFPQRNPPP